MSASKLPSKAGPLTQFPADFQSVISHSAIIVSVSPGEEAWLSARVDLTPAAFATVATQVNSLIENIVYLPLVLFWDSIEVPIKSVISESSGIPIKQQQVLFGIGDKLNAVLQSNTARSAFEAALGEIPSRYFLCCYASVNFY